MGEQVVQRRLQFVRTFAYLQTLSVGQPITLPAALLFVTVSKKVGSNIGVITHE